MREVDLGARHILRLLEWIPQGSDVIEPYGALITHDRGDGNRICDRVILFEPDHVVRSREPLTIEGIIECSCGDRGYVSEGQWVGVQVVSDP